MIIVQYLLILIVACSIYDECYVFVQTAMYSRKVKSVLVGGALPVTMMRFDSAILWRM